MRKVSLFIFTVTAAVTIISAEIFNYSARLISCHVWYRMTAELAPVSGQVLPDDKPRPHTGRQQWRV